MKLRSEFVPGSWQWVERRAQWKAMGIRDEDFAKPKIAVVNTSSDLSVCYVHLDDVAKTVTGSIRRAGGLPFQIRTAAPSDAITCAGLEARYLMPTRDLIVNDIEVMVEGALLDGMVCLSSCDKTTPAHLMAAARLNLPSIVVPCGYQLGGMLGSEPVDFEDAYEAVGAVGKGLMTLERLERMTDVAVCGPGVCPGLGTANTMHMLAEALGMALPGSTPVRAGGRRLHRFAAAAGHRIVQMVAEDLRSREVITAKSIENAVRVAQAIGGSVNCVRHLSAIAAEREIELDVVRLFERLADESVLLCEVRPNGPARIEALEAAGGTLGVMKRLRRSLRTEAVTVGGPLSEVLSRPVKIDERVIRTVSRPISRKAGLMIIRGNLAPQGAIVKASAVPAGMDLFEGQARVYEDEEHALADIGDIAANEVVVLRCMGPRGGPGTVFACAFVAAVNGAGISHQIAVVTDGELSGLNRGLTVGQVMPEAAEGGPLAVVQQGEKIRVDLRKRKIDLLVPAEEIRRRMSRWKPKPLQPRRSWLSLYAQLVQPISKGAVLGESRPRRAQS